MTGSPRSPLFEKCGRYRDAHEAAAAGLYPYYLPIGASTGTEVSIRGAWKIMVGSNNYLGLTHHPRVLEAAGSALRRFGSGSTGSRLLNGTLTLHEDLEERLATFFRKEAALVYTTGYLTNIGIVSALVGRDDHVFLDRLNHACLVDGARLSHGRVRRYPHGDLGALERLLRAVPAGAGKLIATDGVFSMEGDIADLPELVRLARAYRASLLVDDAHALGVLGEDGAGTARHFGLDDEVDLVMATFSKSLASIGGVVAGPREVIHYLRHHSRQLIFSASMPPASVAGVLAALDVMEAEPERRKRLCANSRRMREGLRAEGFDTGRSRTPIVPVHIGEVHDVLLFWRKLFDLGVFAHAVVPPAVPPHSCRIRVSLTSAHTDEQIDTVIAAFAATAREVGVPVLHG